MLALDIFKSCKETNLKCFDFSEQVQAVSTKDKAEEQIEVNKARLALEEQMDQLRDVHQKQVGSLRDELMEKQTLISELKE